MESSKRYEAVSCGSFFLSRKLVKKCDYIHIILKKYVISVDLLFKNAYNTYMMKETVDI